ncbi:MAG: phage tail length tape measure family protein [Candidatus Competibacteraceae bacterium]|nr:phage tail length tape measure family protein [Candidatus Competibacteraceae bacterium]
MGIRDLALQFVMTAKDNTSSVVNKISNGFSNLSNIVAGLAATLGRLASSTFGFEIPGISESTDAAEKLEVQMGKLRAAVTATGGAAGLTAEDIDAMARRLDEATLGSAEGFRNAATELLTFKSVGIDAFERTLMAAQDLADAGFGTVESATVQLGKALEDPIKGLTALTRVGVSFTEEQKAMIENFVKLGDVASAQNVILAAVEGQVKGVASAAGGGLAGAVDLVGKRMTDLKETIGSVLLPILTTLNLAWADVIGAVQKTASGLAGTLKSGAEQASGAIKSLATGIGEFISGAVKDLADWITHLDWSDVQAGADATKAKIAQLGTAFSEMGSAGTKAVAVLSLGFNAIQSGFRTLAAGLLAITSGVVSTLATVEEAASKIGLGSLERANELRETASQMAGAAEEITAKIAENGESIKRAYDTLAGSTDVAAAANQRLKDGLPATEIQTLNKSLADYATIAERANTAAQQAQQDFFAGKIGLEQLADAADAAVQASNDLAAAQVAAATATKQADEATKAAAPTLLQQVENTQDAADSQSEYTSALEQAGQAQADALRAEIALAQAKRDSATVATKSVELAELEAAKAEEVAAAKQQEAVALQQVVQAQAAYLGSIGGGTELQKQELEIQKLRYAQLLADVAATSSDAEAKKLAIDKLKSLIATKNEDSGATEQHVAATKEDTKATEEQAKSYQLMEDAAIGALRELSGLSDGMNALISNMLHVNNIGESFGHNFRGELGQLRLQMEQVNQAIEHNRNIIGPYFDAFERNVDIANQARKAYLEQAVAATELAGRLKDASDGANTNTAALSNLVSEAERGISGMGLLDQQTLSRLQSEIDAANAKLRQMQQEADDARANIARLNAEIAAEQGDTEKAALLKQQLDYQQALADIEAKRAEAEAAGNRELIALYDEQIKKLDQLNALKEKNIKADAKSSSDSTSSTSSSASGSASKSTTSSSASGGISSGGGGITINVNAGNAQVLDNNFVEKLARALQPINQRLTRLGA